MSVQDRNRLFIYYGYPIDYKALWDVEAIVTEIANNYDIWVVGDTYQDPLHEVYATTVEIISKLRQRGVTIYGYVPIGQNTSGLTNDQIKLRIDQWVTVGVDGIFLDEFGFDYANTRLKQIEIVNYVYGKNLPYCANAWVFEDVVCGDIAELGFPVDDWRYVNFQTYNPTNAALPFTINDSYLIENFCIDNTGVLNAVNGQQRCLDIQTRNKTKGITLWAEAVLAEPATPNGAPNYAKTGSLKSMKDIAAYVTANAFLLDIKTVGIGGYSFGSNGHPIDFVIPSLPDTATQPKKIFADVANGKFVGKFGSTTLTVLNNTVQNVSMAGSQGLSSLLNNIAKRATSTQQNKTTTAAAITGFNTTMVPGGIYEIEAFVTFTSANTTNGISLNHTSPAGTEVHAEVSIPVSTVAGNTAFHKTFPAGAENANGASATTSVSAANAALTAHYKATVTCGSTAGDFQLTFASKTSNVAITIQAGSTYVSKRIA